MLEEKIGGADIFKKMSENIQVWKGESLNGQRIIGQTKEPGVVSYKRYNTILFNTMKRMFIKTIYEFGTFYVRNKSDLVLSNHVAETTIKVYTGCASLDVKKAIYRDNIRKSGIYRWVNLVNGETYIGSAVDLTERLRDYLSPRWLEKEVLKHNSIIYRALLKYGYDKFRLEILEYCDRSLTIEREQYYIDKYKPTYNICKIAGSSLGRITRNTTKLKLRNAWLVRLYKSNQSLLGFSNFTLNYFLDKVTKLENNILMLQNKLDSILANKDEFKESAEVRLKKLKGSQTAESVMVTDLTTGVTTKYLSARSAALALGASNSTVMNKLNGKNTNLYKGRFIIKKAK